LPLYENALFALGRRERDVAVTACGLPYAYRDPDAIPHRTSVVYKAVPPLICFSGHRPIHEAESRYVSESIDAGFRFHTGGVGRHRSDPGTLVI
jgi:hypothetical protein